MDHLLENWAVEAEVAVEVEAVVAGGGFSGVGGFSGGGGRRRWRRSLLNKI